MKFRASNWAVEFAQSPTLQSASRLYSNLFFMSHCPPSRWAPIMDSTRRRAPIFNRPLPASSGPRRPRCASGKSRSI